MFIEENVTGACGCPERDLRILLAQQRQRNGASNQDFASVVMSPSRNASSLPDLDPSMLLSAVGQNELLGAQQLRPNVSAAGCNCRSRPCSCRSRGQTQHVAYADDAQFDNTLLDSGGHVHAPDDEGIDFGSGDWTGSWQEPRQHNARVASMGQVDLAAMWMQGTGIPYDPGQLHAPDHLDDFSFDTGEMNVDATSYPRGGGGGGQRFRVDGAAPARPTFDRSIINNQGPMREAARVGQNGRFAVLREQPPAPPPPTIFEQVARDAGVPYRAPPTPDVTVPARAPSALQQARQLQASSRVPSTYDRLRNNPFEK